MKDNGDDGSGPSKSEALDPQIIAKLSEAIADLPLQPAVAQRMRARIMAAIGGSTETSSSGEAAGSTTSVVRAAEGRWVELLPGIEVKMLHVDQSQETQTALWRLAPAARMPAHTHSKAEECLVLEGSIINEGITYGTGDYMHVDVGVYHEEFVSSAGALLILRGQIWAAA